MKLTTALVNVSIGLKGKLDYSIRSYESERTKPSSRRANDRLEILLAQRKEVSKILGYI